MEKNNAIAAVVAEIKATGQALMNLANVLSEVQETEVREEVKEEAKEEVKEEDKEEVKEKTYTFEEVRTLLTLKSREGKTEAVRALLQNHGAATLSALKEADYAKVMKAAEEL